MPSEAISNLQAWTEDTGEYDVQWKVFPMAGRIDVSRGMGMAWAKKDEAAHIQLDADVQVITPFKQALSYLREDFEAGWGLVCAATVAFNGSLMAALPEEGTTKLTGLGVFAVDRSAFGFAAFSPELVRTMKPLAESPMVGSENYTVPLYGFSAVQTEDYSTCDNARKQGFRVGIDGRIKVVHIKSVRLLNVFEDEPRPPPMPGVLQYVQHQE